MRHITDRIRALVRPKRARERKPLSEKQLRTLRRNLSALLRTKEHLAEQR